MGSELIHLLEQEARTEVDRVLAEARARAEEIVAAARREADEIRAAARRRAEDHRLQARTRATSTARLRAAALVLAAKDEAIRQVFDGVEDAVRAAMRDPARRRAVLHSFLREAVATLGEGRFAVEVAPEDVASAREAVRDLGVEAEVRGTPQVQDGVRLVSADGRSVVENTVSSRLARARRELVSEVAAVLWGAQVPAAAQGRPDG